MKDKKIVLFIEWSNIGRDLEMHLPTMYFFEEVLGWQVYYKHINNIPSILKIKPNMIIMSSISGADIYVEIAKYINDSKIPFFVNTTEGFFREKDIEEFVWGWNKEKIIYEHLCNYWSYKSYNLMLKYYPNRLKISRMCGSLGHDKYALIKKKKTIETKYKKVIGFAAFDYNKIIDNKERFSKDQFSNIMNNMTTTINILNELTTKNKDILFIIKSHPSDMGRVPLEIKEILDFDNVILLDYSISIVEAISNSDIWLSFSSGSILEAWLQDIPTISFITNETNFSSEAIYGSVLESNPIEINNMIKEFYKTNKILRFEEKQQLRESLIKDFIGFNDGFNHVRYLSTLQAQIENEDSIQKHIKVSIKYKVKGSLRYLVYSITKNKYKIPFLKKYAHIYGNWNEKIFNNQRKLFYDNLDLFYKKNNKKIMKIYNRYEDDFKKENIDE